MRTKKEQPITSRGLLAEKAALGCLMLDNRQWNKIASIVTGADFHGPGHKTIFESMERCAKDGRPFDPALVAENATGDYGGYTYLAQLESYCVSPETSVSHARVVRRESLRRHLIELHRAALEREDDPELVGEIEATHKRIEDLEGKAHEAEGERNSFVTDVLETVDRIQAGVNAESSAIHLGFSELDNAMGGLQPGNLCVVAGATGGGKTSFLLTAIRNVSVWGRIPSMVFSLEMSRGETIQRLIALHGSIPVGVLRNPRNADPDILRRIASAGQAIGAAPIAISDKNAVTVSAIRSAVLEEKERNAGLSLVGIDYLQIMRPGSRRDNRATEVAEISGALKRLAREADVAVIALSQLSRDGSRQGHGKSTDDGRPRLWHLRESGAIEQDADFVLFTWWPESENGQKEISAELILAKSRHGRPGTFSALFVAPFCRFDDNRQTYKGPYA